MMIKTGDVVRALKSVFPKITEDMVRSAAEEGVFTAVRRNPFSERGAYDYCPKSIVQWLETQAVVTPDQKREVLARLGLNFQQLRLLAA